MTRKLTRRRILHGAATAALSVSTLRSATGWPSASRSRSRESKTVGSQLRVLIPSGSEANVRPVALAFEKATGATVTLEVCGTDDVATEILLRAIAGEESLDLALPPTFSVPDLVEAKAIQPLGARSQGLGLEASLCSLGDHYKGVHYGQQTDGDVYLMFYNGDFIRDERAADAYEAKHEEKLEVASTWEQLDRQMEFFHDPANGRFGGALFRTPNYIAWEYWIRLHAKGMFPVSDDLRPLIESPAGVAAAEELIRASKWLAPGAASAGLFENWELFGQGNTFCDIGWGGSQKYFQTKAPKIAKDLVYGPTPGGEFGGRTMPISYFNWGWNFTVFSKAQEPELASQFAHFATHGEPSLRAIQAADGFFDPFRAEHYDDKQVQTTYTKPFLDQHRRSMGEAIPDFYLAGRGEYFDLLGRFLTRANEGKLGIQQALEIIAKGWEQITEKKGRDSQIEQWAFLKSRYPKVLRESLRSSD